MSWQVQQQQPQLFPQLFISLYPLLFWQQQIQIRMTTIMIHHQLFSPQRELEEHISYFLLSKISLHTMEEAARWLHGVRNFSQQSVPKQPPHLYGYRRILANPPPFSIDRKALLSMRHPASAHTVFRQDLQRFPHKPSKVFLCERSRSLFSTRGSFRLHRFRQLPVHSGGARLFAD